MPLYFITGNTHKFSEMRDAVADLEHLPIDLPEMQSLDPREVVRAKLIAAREHHTGDFIVEDVSLCMDALNGLPGPFIKFFLEALGREGLAALAGKLRNAQAICTIGLLQGDDIHFFEGRVSGEIVPPRGESGFGWDPIFLPRGSGKTFAEMSADEKNAISHRGKAVEKLKGFLES